MIQENGLTLAYIGDAIYELRIREYLLSLGLTHVKELHKNAINYTSAISQAEFIESYMNELTEEELEMFKRGRNSGGTHKPKNASLGTYRIATGFESLLGFLYLSKNNERLEEIIKLSIDFINKRKSLNSAL